MKERQVGNTSVRCKGVGVFRSALLRHKGVRGFGDALDASWLRMEPEGSGLHWVLGDDSDNSGWA